MGLSLNMITTESYPEVALKIERYYLLGRLFVLKPGDIYIVWILGFAFVKVKVNSSMTGNVYIIFDLHFNF
jgi:hypothetical protein